MRMHAQRSIPGATTRVQAADKLLEQDTPLVYAETELKPLYCLRRASSIEQFVPLRSFFLSIYEMKREGNRKAEVQQEPQKTKHARNIKSSTFASMAQQHHHDSL